MRSFLLLAQKKRTKENGAPLPLFPSPGRPSSWPVKGAIHGPMTGGDVPVTTPSGPIKTSCLPFSARQKGVKRPYDMPNWKAVFQYANLHSEISPHIFKRLRYCCTVALIGPRRWAKITLAKHIISKIKNAVYLDLKRPVDANKLRDPEIFLN